MRGLAPLAALAAAVGLLSAFAGNPVPAAGLGRSPGPRARSGPFGWLVPAPAPPTWSHETAPTGATLSYPAPFAPVTGDPGSISAAVPGEGGPFRAYLNVTPRQGDERAQGFAAFRAHLLGAEHDRSVRREAAAEGLAFLGGTGSCVLDDYVTRTGHHQYREVACLVTGSRAASVVVAAATTRDWSRYRPLLRQVVASFAVS